MVLSVLILIPRPSLPSVSHRVDAERQCKLPSPPGGGCERIQRNGNAGKPIIVVARNPKNLAVLDSNNHSRLWMHCFEYTAKGASASAKRLW